MKTDGENLIAAIIEAAPEIVSDSKPRLLIEDADPDRTVDGLIEVLANAGGLFERGVAVRVAPDPQGLWCAHEITPNVLVTVAHRACRPYRKKRGRDGATEEVNARLPLNIAKAYCELHGERRLVPLNGIASAPLLRDGGSICSTSGYDRTTGIGWRASQIFVGPFPRTRPDATPSAPCTACANGLPLSALQMQR